MEGYNKPEITREDMAEAENVFLSITSDGDVYREKGPTIGRYVRDQREALRLSTQQKNARLLRHYLTALVCNYADKLERQELCNGPISYMARAIAAIWLEDYYRDHIADGGLAA